MKHLNQLLSRGAPNFLYLLLVFDVLVNTLYQNLSEWGIYSHQTFPVTHSIPCFSYTHTKISPMHWREIPWIWSLKCSLPSEGGNCSAEINAKCKNLNLFILLSGFLSKVRDAWAIGGLSTRNVKLLLGSVIGGCWFIVQMQHRVGGAGK